MLTLEWLAAIIGGFIRAPLDHPLLRTMRRGSEIAVKFPQVLYISMGFGQTKPALHAGYEFQQTYAQLAGVALRQLKFAGWAMKPQVHSFNHTLVEIKAVLRQGAIKIANPLIHSCDQNEDLVGKISRSKAIVEAGVATLPRASSSASPEVSSQGPGQPKAAASPVGARAAMKGKTERRMYA